MSRWMFVLVILVGCFLIGCSNNDNEMTGEKPPKVSLEIGDEKYDTKLGTYCWKEDGKGLCVDTAGPVKLLEGKDPIKVKPGETISFLMDYEPKPTEFTVEQFINNKVSDVEIIDNEIKAPMKKGVYYYSYGVWWKDEKDSNVSNGDAFYAFVIEVD